MSTSPSSSADEITAVAAAPRNDRLPAAVWVIVAVFAVVELAFSDRFGFQQDELYFLVASHHLAFGYVDQPPLAVLMARTTGIFGVDPAAIRIIPALAGAAVVLIAARTAALFGASRAGRVLAALAMAAAPVLISSAHVGNTTPYDLLAWAVVLLCVVTALLRGRPRWWLGAGLAAGIGLEDDYLVALLILVIVIGILATSAHRRVIATPWPWLGGVIALAIWAPNLTWQFAHGWPQLAMAGALHQQNTSAGDYIGNLPEQFLYAGVLGTPLIVVGMMRLWRAPELRFLGVAVAIVVIYLLAWVPGKVYYTDGMLPIVLAAGAVPAGEWLTSARDHVRRRRLVVVGTVIGTAITALGTLPVVPLAIVHNTNASTTVTDTVGWPQLTADVAAQDEALTRAGASPTAIYTAAYAQAGALDTYGGHDHLPPVVSAHNTFWMWGPGNASDRTVLVVGAGAITQLRQYFASCRTLTVFNPPDQVKSDWNHIAIGVCAGPSASWRTLWPRLKHYD